MKNKFPENSFEHSKFVEFAKILLNTLDWGVVLGSESLQILMVYGSDSILSELIFPFLNRRYRMDLHKNERLFFSSDVIRLGQLTSLTKIL